MAWSSDEEVEFEDVDQDPEEYHDPDPNAMECIDEALTRQFRDANAIADASLALTACAPPYHRAAIDTIGDAARTFAQPAHYTNANSSNDGSSSLDYSASTSNVIPDSTQSKAKLQIQKSLRFEESASKQSSQFTSAQNRDDTISPSSKPNITIPKRRYSLFRQESIIEMMNTLPSFFTDGKTLKGGPSSQNTVLTLAGLLVCGLTLLASAFIVLLQQREPFFLGVGLAFLVIGLAMLVTLSFLQRKNITKFLRNMRDDFNLKRADKLRYPASTQNDRTRY